LPREAILPHISDLLLGFGSDALRRRPCCWFTWSCLLLNSYSANFSWWGGLRFLFAAMQL